MTGWAMLGTPPRNYHRVDLEHPVTTIVPVDQPYTALRLVADKLVGGLYVVNFSSLAGLVEQLDRPGILRPTYRPAATSFDRDRRPQRLTPTARVTRPQWTGRA